MTPTTSTGSTKLLERTKFAFRGTDERYTSNAWFYDVLDRFRVFKHDGNHYIAKKCSREKAEDEVEKATRAYDIIDGLGIYEMTIRVIVPRILSDETEPETAYLVSHYAGADLNTYSYEGGQPALTAEQYVEIVKTLIAKGVVHSGFLPRNIIEDGTTMYLLDMEDAVFIGANREVGLDRLWYTNFLLNWSYLYEKSELMSLLLNLTGGRIVEIPLIRYEQTFKKIAGIEVEDTELREIIERIVFAAEMPNVGGTRHGIRPNDLGHLVADVYPVELDIFHDMATCVVRVKDEGRYDAINALVSKIVQLCWISTEQHRLSYFLLVGLLCMLDESLDTKDITKAVKQPQIADILVELSGQMPNSLVASYMSHQLTKARLGPLVEKMITEAVNLGPVPSEGVEAVTDLILAVQEKDMMLNAK